MIGDTSHVKWSDFGDDDLIDDRVAATLLCASKHTLRQWRRGDDPRGPRFVRVGALIRYRIADLKRFVERNAVSTTGDPAAPAVAAVRRVG